MPSAEIQNKIDASSQKKSAFLSSPFVVGRGGLSSSASPPPSSFLSPSAAVAEIKVDAAVSVADPNDIQADVEKEREAVIDRLSEYVYSCWEEAKREKQDCGINDRLINNLRQYKGEYGEEALAQIRETGGTDTFRKLTMMKSESVESWLKDSLLIDNDKPWSISPTPRPDLRSDIQDIIINRALGELADKLPNLASVSEADLMNLAYEISKKYRDEVQESVDEEGNVVAKRMERQIEDQFEEGNWKQAMSDVINDFVIFPSCFIWGPFLKNKDVLKYVNKDGVVSVEKEIKPILYFERVSPFDIYPSPKAVDVNDGYLCHRFYISRYELSRYKSLPGFNIDAIDFVLREGEGNTSLGQFADDNDNDRKEVETKSPNSYNSDKNILEGIFFYGYVQGDMLQDWGLEPGSLTESYHVTCTMVGRKVIKAIINDDLIYQRPYSKASFKPVPGSFWGISLPETIEDIQKQCNAVVRALCNNISISSGPYLAIDVSQFPPGYNFQKIKPWMIFLYNGNVAMNNRQPVTVHQIDCNASQLLPIYNSFKQEADDVTNIPAFMYGSSMVQGAGETASGLAMLQGNAMKGIKKLVSEISNLIKGTVTRTFWWNMLYNEDNSIKGDLCVVVRGPLSVVTKEVRQLRLNEFFNRIANPTIIQLIGVHRFINILREIAKQLDLPLEQIVPSRREMEQIMALQMQSQMAEAQGGGGGQAAVEEPKPDGGSVQPQNTAEQRAARLLDKNEQSVV